MVSTGDDGANARMSKVVMPKCRLSYCQIQHLLRDGRAKHHFRAGAPNELWITDATEFRILAGKTYLSPIIDCFDGMPISWTISATPDAEIAKSSLLSACSQLKEGEHPKGHSDWSCHYRWPGWIRICNEHCIVRSMSRKGYSPDNARRGLLWKA